MKDDEEYNRDREELIIDPNIDVIRRKKQFYVNFDKQIGREDLEKKDVFADEYYI